MTRGLLVTILLCFTLATAAHTDFRVITSRSMADSASSTEQYKKLMDAVTAEKYEKMSSQMKEYSERKEEQDHKWRICIIACVIISLLPVFKVVKGYLCGELPKPSAGELMSAGFLCLSGSVVIFLLNLAALYMSFHAGYQEQMALFCVIILACAIALWYFARRKTSK